MRTFMMNVLAFAVSAAALGACGVGNDCGHGVENCSTDSDITDDTNDTSDKPTGEIEVDLTYPDGSTADGVKVGFGDVVSGKVTMITAGDYSVSVDPFEGQGTDWFVADDGDNDVTVAANESATVTVGLDRFVSSSGSATPIGDQGADAHTVYDYNCWSYYYDYNGQQFIDTMNPDDSDDHGWFSIETGVDGVLHLRHETKGRNNLPDGDNDNGLRIDGDKLRLTGDVDGDYPYRMEQSSVEKNGDFTFVVAVPTDRDADKDSFIPNYWLGFECLLRTGR